MDEQLLKMGLIVILAALALAWALSALFFRVSGTWLRELSERDRARGVQPERIELTQLGPFVSGRRELPGGYQEFSGVLLWSTLRLKRRDCGEALLVAQGFPKHIAPLLDGQVTARLVLRVEAGGAVLRGSFTPQEINFTHQPPRITSRVYRAPEPRSYTRLEHVDDVAHDPGWDLAEQEPAASHRASLRAAQPPASRVS